MRKLSELIKRFEDVKDWRDFIKDNFERKTDIYNYATITNLEVKTEDKVFTYPTKIVFMNGYTRCKKYIRKKETLTVGNLKYEITERKKIIPLSYYDRNRKHPGEIYQIIRNIVGGKSILEGKFSDDLFTANDDPLYSIDSKQKWPSYILILKGGASTGLNIREEEKSLYDDLLMDYGINYEYEPFLKNYMIFVFTIPYIKIVENKIKKYEGKESIFLVLRFNQLGLYYSPKIKIEVDALIKDIKNNILYKKISVINFDRAKYQIVELIPDENGEIGYSEILIKINNVLVNKSSGYYIREFKLDMKVE